MDSSSVTPSDRAQNVSKQCDNTFPATTKYASSRRTPSFSSTSSLSSCSFCSFPDDSPPSPATPPQFSGVPFSWEHLPGIPKKPNKKKETASKVLPLPPPAILTPPTSKRFNLDGRKKIITSERFGSRDPFFAALLECSKDDHDRDQDSISNLWSGAKVTRSISDRFGFINLNTLCKTSCGVSDSIVCLPRPTASSYDLIDRRNLHSA